LEETGLEVNPRAMFEIFERILRDADGLPEYHYVLMDYLCEIAGGALQAGDDVSRVQWFEKDALQDLRLTEGTLAVILKAFQQ
jgi:ADP-ribose pyrophosphatase